MLFSLYLVLCLLHGVPTRAEEALMTHQMSWNTFGEPSSLAQTVSLQAGLGHIWCPQFS